MNQERAQYLAAGLAAVLIILVGGVIFVVLNRPAQGPNPSPTPTSVAAISPGASPSFSPLPTLSPGASLPPSPTLLATASPELTASPIPIDTPLITPEVTPEITLAPTLEPTVAPPTATPLVTLAPTPEAPPDPTSPDRELRLAGFGLDAKDLSGIERYLRFTTDGPSLVRAEISNATGQVDLCLWKGNDVPPRCPPVGDSTVERATFETGTTEWTISLIGHSTSTSPVVDLTVDFNAENPSVEFENVRFRGLPVANYNGLNAVFDALPGTIAVSGKFDSTQVHNWQIVISESGPGEVFEKSGGPSNSFGPETYDVTAANSTYVINVQNPNPSAEPGPVFVSIVLAAPFGPPPQ